MKNQARMHLRNYHKPYVNSKEAISFWPETATAIAIRLNSSDSIEYIAPYGLEDLFNLIVQRTPNFNVEVYQKRVQQKNWKSNWEKLQVLKYSLFS